MFSQTVTMQPVQARLLRWMTAALAGLALAMVLALAAPARADGLALDDPEPLGDIAIAWETCAREAADQGKPMAKHVTHLIVHGVLHLLGYDHVEEEDAALMEGLEVRILASLGVSDPY